jgi:hypothetical protein
VDKSLTLQIPAAEAAEISRTWQEYLNEMAQLREKIQNGRREIEVMQTDNTAMLGEIKTMLSRIESR